MPKIQTSGTSTGQSRDGTNARQKIQISGTSRGEGRDGTTGRKDEPVKEEDNDNG